MSKQKDHLSPPEWAEPALGRTVSLDTHEPDRKSAVQTHGEGHDDEGDDHALEWPEMLRIALVAVAAAILNVTRLRIIVLPFLTVLLTTGPFCRCPFSCRRAAS